MYFLISLDFFPFYLIVFESFRMYNVKKITFVPLYQQTNAKIQKQECSFKNILALLIFL
jgi:hypothetical protein